MIDDIPEDYPEDMLPPDEGPALLEDWGPEDRVQLAEPDMLTLAECAAKLGVRLTTVQRWARQGDFPTPQAVEEVVSYERRQRVMKVKREAFELFQRFYKAPKRRAA